MDRRGHAMQGMDSVYIHVTDDMRHQLCNYLERLWQQGVAERYKLAPRSAVPLLDQALVAYAKKQQSETSTQQRLRATRTRPQTRSRG
jgi:gamma-glutamyl:cysteine ligase YbdK (ATP-grasp superfamily)